AALSWKRGAALSHYAHRKLSRTRNVAIKGCAMFTNENKFTGRPKSGQIESEKDRAFASTRSSVGNTYRSYTRSDERHLRCDERHPCRCVRAVLENEK